MPVPGGRVTGAKASKRDPAPVNRSTVLASRRPPQKHLSGRVSPSYALAHIPSVATIRTNRRVLGEWAERCPGRGSIPRPHACETDMHTTCAIARPRFRPSGLPLDVSLEAACLMRLSTCQHRHEPSPQEGLTPCTGHRPGGAVDCALALGTVSTGFNPGRCRPFFPSSYPATRTHRGQRFVVARQSLRSLKVMDLPATTGQQAQSQRWTDGAPGARVAPALVKTSHDRRQVVRVPVCARPKTFSLTNIVGDSSSMYSKQARNAMERMSSGLFPLGSIGTSASCDHAIPPYTTSGSTYNGHT